MAHQHNIRCIETRGAELYCSVISQIIMGPRKKCPYKDVWGGKCSLDRYHEGPCKVPAHTVTRKGRDIFKSGVRVAEIVGYRTNHPRFGASSTIRIRRLSDGAYVNDGHGHDVIYAYMDDARNDIQSLTRDGWI